MSLPAKRLPRSDIGASVFTPEIDGRVVPEYNLYVAVIHRALLDIGWHSDKNGNITLRNDPPRTDWSGVHPTTKAGRYNLLQNSQDALKWFLDDNDENIFSFLGCCRIVGLNPVACRKALNDYGIQEVARGWEIEREAIRRKK